MKNLISRLSFPEEAKEQAVSIYEKIMNSEYRAEFEDGVQTSLNNPEFNIAEYANGFSEKINENLFSFYLVHFLACALEVKAEYEKRGISDEVYYDTMNDMSYKVEECKRIYDIYGLEAYNWYRRIFRVEIFKLGRLEYGVTTFPEEEGYGNYIKKGERSYDMHIPAAGPLTYESVIDSLKRAYKFFGCKDNMVVHCNTWLLYPPFYREVFTEGSNMCMFYELFDIIKETPQETKIAINKWVFGIPGDDFCPEKSPADTRLQKNFINYFKEEKSAGLGFGIIVFDGEKIINK